MKPLFRLTPRAYADLRNIALYTRKQWGDAQREKYMRALDGRFHWLAEHPRSGKHRPDITEGYYCFPQGSHLIFYLIGTAVIDIIGVPHKQMDVPSYFGEIEP
ncbi:MAG: type II toxin-antitoxin system RelE/ParE family toxin [Steroidobacteraceae bacterium]|jgi:toxin ParE1/3/4